MKIFRTRLALSAAGLFLMSLLGCNVQEATVPILSQEGVNLELVQEVEAIVEPKVQKIAFTNMLSKTEKVYIFQKRIVDKMQEMTLSTEQKALLNDALTHMTPSMYDDGETNSTRQYFDSWTNRARMLFSDKVLRDIVSSLSPVGEAATQGRDYPNDSSCICATQSDYCKSGYDCTLIVSCNGRGCGTMWMSVCNGHCDWNPPQW